MPLPQEDMGPAWLRDWGNKTGYTQNDTATGYVDGQSLAVDIESLVGFANALQTEHEQDFRPHVQEVFDGWAAEPAGPPGPFVELVEVMTHHRDMLVQASTALANHDTAIMAFCSAARAISDEYRGADAMSNAKVSDVDSHLTEVTPTSGTSTSGTGTSTSGTPQNPVVTPEQAAANNAAATEHPGTTPGTTTTTTTTTSTTTTTPGSQDGGKDL